MSVEEEVLRRQQAQCGHKAVWVAKGMLSLEELYL